jgi:flavorubredoxin
MYDVSKTHVSYLIADAFKYSHFALFSVTYNLKVFPPMQAVVEDMAALNLQNRKAVVVENGTWAPQAGTLIRKQLEEMKNIEILNEPTTIKSSVCDATYGGICSMADAIVESMK